MTTQPRLRRTRWRAPKGARPGLWLLASVLLFLPGGGKAQEMALPVDVQWSLFDRILAFDREFPARSTGEMVVGVLYQSRYRPSLNARNDVLSASVEVPTRLLDGSRVRLVSIDASGGFETRLRLQEEQVDVLYVAPLRSLDLSQIVQLSQDMGFVTLTGVREYVEMGIAIGLGIRGGRPEIVVNLAASRAAGMDLSSELLKLATVMGPAPGGSGPAPLNTKAER